MDVGSCINTFVSSTKSRLPSRGLVFMSRGSLDAAAPGPGSERLRRFKNFLRVTRDFHLAPLLSEHALAVQEEGAALDAKIFLTVKTLLLMTSKSLQSCSSGSLSNGNGSFSFSVNFTCDATLSREDSDDLACLLCGMPRRGRENPDFSFVHPAVMSLRVEVDDQLLPRRVLQAPLLASVASPAVAATVKSGTLASVFMGFVRTSPARESRRGSESRRTP